MTRRLASEFRRRNAALATTTSDAWCCFLRADSPPARAIGDTLYVWTSSGWRVPATGGASGPGAAQGLALMTTSGSGIQAYTLVAQTAQGIVPANASNVDHAGMIAGVTLESGGGNQQVMVQIAGPVRFPSAVFAVSRGTAFVGLSGEPTHALKTSSRFVQQIGVIVRSDEMHLQLAVGTTVMLDAPYTPSVVAAPPATTTIPGLVEFAEHGEVAPLKAIQADDPRLAGLSGGASFYRHTQSTPSTVWTVNHGLGYYPNVEVVDSAGNEIIGDVDHVSTASLTITFGSALSGVADCS